MFAVYKKAAEDGGKKKKSLPYDDMANLHSKWFLRECGLGGRKKKVPHQYWLTCSSASSNEIYFPSKSTFYSFEFGAGARVNTQFSYDAAGGNS
jgi:hypothetical protein